MSSSNRLKAHSSEILRSRYCDLLEGTVACKIASNLHDHGLLTDEELHEILSCDNDAKQHQHLLDTLTRKGIPMLTKLSPAIKAAKQQIIKESRQSQLGLVQTPASSESPHKSVGDCEGFPGTGLPHDNCDALNGGSTASPMPPVLTQTAELGHSNSDSMLANGHGLVPSGSVALDGRMSECSRNIMQHLLSRKQLSQKMEAFTVLLFTFLSQLRVSIDQQLSTTRSGLSPSDKESASTQKQGDKNRLSWMTLDVEWQSMRDYFPTELLKGVNPSAKHFVPLRMSVLLDAFQQLSEKHTKLVQDSASLQRMLEDDTSTSHPFSSPAHSDESSEVLQQKLKRLERAFANSEERCQQLVVVTQQWSAECADKDKLIAVQATQIQQLDSECEKIQKKLNKYKKHWLETKDAKDAEPKRVSDSQFEELRLELACRRELHDQVIIQRDEAEKKVVKLAAEVEELKDLTEELKDRLSNYKVQAQAKEPAVREMSQVLEENRKLKEELVNLQKQNLEQSDKLLAYETYVNELTSSRGEHLQHKQQAPPTVTGATGATVLPPSNPSPTSAVPKPHPRKKPTSQQAMVTGGFGIPSHIKREVRNRVPQFKALQQQHDGRNDARETPLHGAHPLDHHKAFSANCQPYHRHAFDGSDDDSSSVSTMSSSVSSQSSQKHSFLNARDVGTHRPGSAPGKSDSLSAAANYLSPQLKDDIFSSHSAPTTPLKSRFNQSDSRTDKTTEPQSAWGASYYPKGVHLPPSLHSATPPHSNLNGGGDYTQQIRYPNNSGVIVKPLTHDERSIHHGNGLSNGTAATPLQVIKEPLAILPADSALYSFTMDEKQCPVCQHVFVTLTDQEFNSHVALCFK